MDIRDVGIAEKAERKLEQLPKHIAFKLQTWIDGVKTYGLRAMRMIPGYHDEPLKGKRRGQRSVRLSKAYRAIYRLVTDDELHFVEILEVNKHEY